MGESAVPGLVVGYLILYFSIPAKHCKSNLAKSFLDRHTICQVAQKICDISRKIHPITAGSRLRLVTEPAVPQRAVYRRFTTITDAEGRETHASFFKERGIHRSWLGNIVKFGFLGCLFAFKSSVRDKALPFPKRRNLCTHDNWLFLVGKTFFKVAVLDTPLVCYRRHGGNASFGSEYAGTPLSFKIRYRLYLIAQLLKRSI